MGQNLGCSACMVPGVETLACDSRGFHDFSCLLSGHFSHLFPHHFATGMRNPNDRQLHFDYVVLVNQS